MVERSKDELYDMLIDRNEKLIALDNRLMAKIARVMTLETVLKTARDTMYGVGNAIIDSNPDNPAHRLYKAAGAIDDILDDKPKPSWASERRGPIRSGVGLNTHRARGREDAPAIWRKLLRVARN